MTPFEGRFGFVDAFLKVTKIRIAQGKRNFEWNGWLSFQILIRVELAANGGIPKLNLIELYTGMMQPAIGGEIDGKCLELPASANALIIHPGVTNVADLNDNRSRSTGGHRGSHASIQ